MSPNDKGLTAAHNSVSEMDSSAFIPHPSSFAAPPKELNKVRLTILVGMMFSLLVAGIFRTPPIVFMAALLGVAPPLAILIGRWSSKRLAVTRDLPAGGQVGDIIYGRVRVHNKAAWPAFLTEVRAGQVIKPFYDLNSEKTPPISAEAEGLHEITVLRPGETVERLQAWRLNRRGVYQLPEPRVASTDPLALFNEPLSSGQAQQITVLPYVVHLERLGFVGGNAARLQAPQHASVVADALDFHGVRPYQPGEPIRRVHWKSTARTGQLQIVEWEENVARDLAILLDTSRSTLAGQGTDNTLETSIVIAASVARHLLEGGYSLQIFCWQNGEDSSLKLMRHDARNLPALNSTLHFLARLLPMETARGAYTTAHNVHFKGVFDEAHKPATKTYMAAQQAALEATLPRLAQEAASQIPAGRATLLLSSTLADLAAARRPLQGRAGAPCYCIALDANSFEPERAKTSQSEFLQFDALTRVVRRGDALAAVLEQMA